MTKRLEWLMGKYDGHRGCCMVMEEAKVQTTCTLLFRSLSAGLFPEDKHLFVRPNDFNQKFSHFTLNNM